MKKSKDHKNVKTETSIPATILFEKLENPPKLSLRHTFSLRYTLYRFHHEKCVYTYPDKTFRLYPCVPGNTEHWDRICKHRVHAERTINLLKDTFALADNRSYSVVIS